MESLVAVVLVFGGFGLLFVFMFSGRDGVRRLVDRMLGRGAESRAGGFPARLLLIATSVMLSFELGIASGGAGAALTFGLIIAAAVFMVVVPNLTEAVLGIMGLLWAVPRMVSEYGADLVLPVVMVSALAALLASRLAAWSS